MLAGDRCAGVVAFEDAVVSFFIDAAELLGIPKSVAAIYGICFASPEPLTYSQIDERLDISAGSISQGLKALRAVNALTVRSDAGSLRGDTDGREGKHRDAYEPNLEFRKLVSQWLEQRLQRHIDYGSVQLSTLLSTVPVGHDEKGVVRDRLAHLGGTHDKARALLPVIKSFFRV